MLFSWGNRGEIVGGAWANLCRLSTHQHNTIPTDTTRRQTIHNTPHPIHTAIHSTFHSVALMLFHAFHHTYNNYNI